MSTDGLDEGVRKFEKREIASLTKLMVIYTCLHLARRWDLDLDETSVEVPYICSQIIGTSANLKPGDVLTIRNLLYGMMLPSGNDAAFLLARFFGIQLHEKEEE